MKIKIQTTAKAPPKAAHPQDCDLLEQMPNIGPALAADLQIVGIHHPADLIGRNAFALYMSLCAATGLQHDVCVLDSFLSICDFMRGAPPTPWWHYSNLRRSRYGAALNNLFKEWPGNETLGSWYPEDESHPLQHF